MPFSLQVLGRIHRIGQTRETFVHRFVMSDTVEENVHTHAQHRAADMDMSAGLGSSGSNAGGGALTVLDIAALLHASWQVSSGEGVAAGGGEDGMGVGSDAHNHGATRVAHLSSSPAL